jgi:RimJ/RimL family protein N-acetyltransferase
LKRIVSGGRVAGYVGFHCGLDFTPPYEALGVERDGELIIGAVFNGYNKHGIELTMAGDAAGFTRAFLRRLGHYVFDELGCLRVSFTTQQDHVVDLVHRLGGQTEGRKRNHFGQGRDGIVLGILREEWKL